MKPLILLSGSFFVSLIILKFLFHVSDYSVSGRIAMSIMLAFTSIGHFLFTEGMSQMIPNFIPYKKIVVYFTGIVEASAAVGLLIPPLVRITAILLIIFFILILPANINAAIKHINYEKATNEGYGVKYLWLRIPLQILFIAWIYIFCLL
jgi:uncharacterized membrane protein